MNGFNIGQSLEDGFSRIFEYMPQLLGALIIVVIGYFIAKLLSLVVRKGLLRARFDRALHRTSAGDYITRVVESPSKFVGKVAFWLTFLLFISMAASVLQISALDRILEGVYSYVPKVIAAVLIFLIASAISGGVAKFVQRVMGKTPTARMISTVVPVVTLSIAAFMILNQLNIAQDIVNILFTAIVGSISLGMALAFGLGGRDVAKDILQQAYDSTQANADQTKRDMRNAKINTKRESQNLKSSM